MTLLEYAGRREAEIGWCSSGEQGQGEAIWTNHFLPTGEPAALLGPGVTVTVSSRLALLCFVLELYGLAGRTGGDGAAQDQASGHPGPSSLVCRSSLGDHLAEPSRVLQSLFQGLARPWQEGKALSW